MDNYWAHNTQNQGFIPLNPNPNPSSSSSRPAQHQAQLHYNLPSNHRPPLQYSHPPWNTQAEPLALDRKGSQPGFDHTHQRPYLPAPQIVLSRGPDPPAQYPLPHGNMSAPVNSAPLGTPVQHDRPPEPREPLMFVSGPSSHGVRDDFPPGRDLSNIPFAGRAPSPPHPALSTQAYSQVPAPALPPGHLTLTHRAPERGSDSDSSLPDARDIDVGHSSTSDSKQTKTRTPKQAATSSNPRKNTSTKSKSRSTGKAKTNEEDQGGTKWSEDDWNALFTFILDVEERNFVRAERKSDNKDFWNTVSSIGLDGKWDGTSARAHWKIGRTIYSIIHQLESFTGGGGDGDEDARFDEDDDKSTSLKKLQQRLENIQNSKPNIDPHHTIKPEIYYNWIRGGDESWYSKMHQRFKDSKTTFSRDIERGSGRLENSDESDDNQSDSTPSSRKRRPKQSRPLTAVEGMAIMFKDLQESRKVASEAKESVAQQRLEFEKERAKLADAALLKKADQDEKLLNFKIEATKRKWAVEDKAHDAEEASKRRRQELEDEQQKQNLILNQIKALEALVSKPDTDAQLKDSLRVRITTLLEKLDG